jgi:hypothetical protein
MLTTLSSAYPKVRLHSSPRSVQFMMSLRKVAENLGCSLVLLVSFLCVLLLSCALTLDSVIKVTR